MRSLVLAALLVPQVHQSDPPAVYRSEVSANFHCYPMPAPEGSKALWCDVDDPATHEKFVVAFISQGSTSVMRTRR